jgi:hypothetical protein
MVVIVWTCITLATFFYWHRSAEMKAVARMPGWFRGNSSSARGGASSRKDVADSAALRERVERVEREEKTALRVREGESTNGTDVMARLTRLESINGTDLMARLTRLEEELTVLREQVLAGNSRGTRKRVESNARHARVQTHAHTKPRKASSTGDVIIDSSALRYDRVLNTGLGDRLSVYLSVAAAAASVGRDVYVYWHGMHDVRRGSRVGPRHASLSFDEIDLRTVFPHNLKILSSKEEFDSRTANLANIEFSTADDPAEIPGNSSGPFLGLHPEYLKSKKGLDCAYTTVCAIMLRL